jgi:hypothetical protein
MVKRQVSAHRGRHTDSDAGIQGVVASLVLSSLCRSNHLLMGNQLLSISYTARASASISRGPSSNSKIDYAGARSHRAP